MAHERICLCCGKTYKYCPNCGEDAHKPGWMKEYDTEACKDIFNAVSAYSMKIGDVRTVQKVLTKHQIKDYSIFKDSVKEILEEVAGKETERLAKVNKKKTPDIELKNDNEMSE